MMEDVFWLGMAAGSILTFVAGWIGLVAAERRSSRAFEDAVGRYSVRLGDAVWREDDRWGS